MSQPPVPDERATDFYVGYFRLPKRHLLLLALIAPVLAGLVVGGSFVVADGQPDAGAGTWSLNTDDPVDDYTGTLRFEPAPVLVTTDDDGTATYLLVGEGKVGVTELVRPLEGQVARISATLIERENFRVLEIVGGEAGVRPLAESMLAEVAVRTETLGERTLVGEVIDPKCYFGAMRPGEGNAHRPCAMLCLLGGIPPMFAAVGPDGRRTFYLLTDAAGQRVEGPALDALLPYVGVPVRITGEATRRGDLLRIAVDLNENIERTGS